MTGGWNWLCPHCGRATTITNERSSFKVHTNEVRGADGRASLVTRFIVCPNPECTKTTLVAALHKSICDFPSGEEKFVGQLRSWDLVPGSAAKIFPDYIPGPIRDDYREACLIKDLSPKASATLSRRCLQGIIRDFWKVKPARLVDEIDAIRTKVDAQTWDAIDAVRKIGNIGAHMERDINLVVDVEPAEADLLIGLVETLLTEWYVHRAEREKRMSSLIHAAASKKAPNADGPGEPNAPQS